MRRDVNVLIFLDVAKALEGGIRLSYHLIARLIYFTILLLTLFNYAADGMKFYISDNKVILTEGFDGVVPVKYFRTIETWPGRQPIPL